MTTMATEERTAVLESLSGADFAADKNDRKSLTAVSQIAGEASSLKAKYIDARLKFLRDLALRGILTPEYVESELMLADLLTKTVDPMKMARLRGLVWIE
ncbi:unnamed protein product [Globisporangium polare]